MNNGRPKRVLRNKKDNISEEDGSKQLETKDAVEEAMERNNWARQNSQRVVELKEEEEEEEEEGKKNLRLDLCELQFFLKVFLPYQHVSQVSK
jgi:hypothetical protein